MIRRLTRATPFSYRSVFVSLFFFFFFNDPATTEIYTLSLHDALPIYVERARAGFRALGEFTRGGTRPVDGYYVTLWRLMLRYPELLAWENLWHDSLRETYAAIYAKVKSIKPGVGVGWHIWHQNSFSPIYRAEQDLTELAKYSDFLKMVMYHNCGGERLAGYIGQVGRTIYGDVPAQELLDFHYRVLDYQGEKPMAGLASAGLSSDYVYREA